MTSMNVSEGFDYLQPEDNEPAKNPDSGRLTSSSIWYTPVEGHRNDLPEMTPSASVANQPEYNIHGQAYEGPHAILLVDLEHTSDPLLQSASRTSSASPEPVISVNFMDEEFDEDRSYANGPDPTSGRTDDFSHHSDTLIDLDETDGLSPHIVDDEHKMESETGNTSEEEAADASTTDRFSHPRFRIDMLSSSPMSSPPQIFSSSPFISSQSSAGSDAEAQKSLFGLEGLSFTGCTKELLAPPCNSSDNTSSLKERVSPFNCQRQGLSTVEYNLYHEEEMPDGQLSELFATREIPPSTTPPVDHQTDTSLNLPLSINHEIELPAIDAHLDLSANCEQFRIPATANVFQPNHHAPGVIEGGDVRKQSKDESSSLGKRTRPHSQIDTAGPSTKRPKVGLLHKQERKLSTPFRTPAIKETGQISRQEVALEPSVSKRVVIQETTDPLPKAIMGGTADIKEKHRTKRASLQFKSPLVNKIPSSASAVRLTPTIQTLERKLQHLKRAVKIRQEGDADTLKELIQKWVGSGREVAWEVWDLVKNTCDGNGEQGVRSNFKDSWGWAEGDTVQGTGHEMIVDDGDQDGNEEVEQRDTLGTMLHSLGIAHEVLGWKEDEGVFQDN